MSVSKVSKHPTLFRPRRRKVRRVARKVRARHAAAGRTLTKRESRRRARRILHQRYVTIRGMGDTS